MCQHKKLKNHLGRKIIRNQEVFFIILLLISVKMSNGSDAKAEDSGLRGPGFNP